MMKNNQMIIEYKWKRDAWLQNENIFIAAFYQILIVQEIEGRRFYFHKPSDLKQEKYILQDVLDEILETKDEDYQNGIIYEVLLSGNGYRLSGAEKECRICDRFFEKSRIPEYVWGAYRLHISIILEIANESMEKAELYAENLLTLLDMRYGMESRQYARMKLYIIGEYYYRYDRELFYTEFENEYDYFKQYTAEWDSFFCDAVLFCVGYLVENGLGKQELWVERGEEEAERWRGNETYGFYKCKKCVAESKNTGKKESG